MMKERFLFVRPPRPLWPFNGPASAFWPPLAFASLAAALRDQVADLEVRILDAPALKQGWRTLEAALREARPHYVGIGEEAVSCPEAFRLADLAKKLGARVIAGGCFFGHVAPEVLATGLVDVVVHGEGERTIVELVEALRTGRQSDLHRVAGISFHADGQPVYTSPRPLIEDLDRLPLPAYDLLPVDQYGRGSRNHPDLAAVELGRGCSCRCNFCVLWRQMGRFGGLGPAPCLRTKSPERLLDEVRILSRRHGRRYLAWVDPCFNADAEVPGRLADLLLRHDLRLGQSAWVRADYLLRDAASGALRRCVRAGLNEVYVGVERSDDAGLRFLNKACQSSKACEAMRLLAADYPEVFRVGSLIYGLPGDSPETMRAIFRLAHELDFDMTFYIPLTPLPGTAYWRDDLWDPSGESFRSFDFLPHVDGDPRMARLTKALHRCFAFRWPAGRLRWLFHGLFARHARRRSIVRRHAIRGLRFAVAGLVQTVLATGPETMMRYPSWYNR